MNTIKIRQMQLSDLQLALSWAALEGWNPGINDVESFYAADSSGFFVGELDGEPIGCISIVCYDKTFAFIGLYIVKPEHRGQGYGTQIWQNAWQQMTQRLDLNRCSVGLDGVVEREETYRRLGFIPAYRHIRHVYELKDSGVVPSSVIPLANVPFAEILRYDAELFPASRPQFLQSWINVKGGYAYGVMESANLTGYGVIRPCHQGFKIGPLFAESTEIADCLFQALTSHAGKQPVFIDIPDVSPAISVLRQRYQLQPTFTCIRMYCYQTPVIDSDRIFGVTTLELG
ncbi:GNAT family N-acetyltransferase [Calothrix sp. UHCC 0171]|uniref:GNAT family N-acetyltransferase n=1 Tax=Calothrix sp. UHCC 0171 TaxID=3110245 RepID=UPI002B20EFD5|nr:GNAT family N-acetyltransferase [Calothrix sp. UHCC 0171]MEA5573411.1 GNAT family N-acetyltransferase [Calothrix sp. UHCC 0171]